MLRCPWAGSPGSPQGLGTLSCPGRGCRAGPGHLPSWACSPGAPCGLPPGPGLLGPVRLGSLWGGKGVGLRGAARPLPRRVLGTDLKTQLFIFRNNDSLPLGGPDVISGLKSNIIFLRNRILSGLLVKISAASPVNGTRGRRRVGGFLLCRVWCCCRVARCPSSPPVLPRARHRWEMPFLSVVAFPALVLAMLVHAMPQGVCRTRVMLTTCNLARPRTGAGARRCPCLHVCPLDSVTLPRLRPRHWQSSRWSGWPRAGTVGRIAELTRPYVDAGGLVFIWGILFYAEVF